MRRNVSYSPYEIVKISRHPERPHFQDLLGTVFQNPLELKGDRLSGDDQALWAGFATVDNLKIVLVGQKKGRTPEEQKTCHYAMVSPSGYHKARRLFELAEKFQKPLISIVDTPGAYPGLAAEQHLQARTIAYNLKVLSELTIPSIALVLGEGGSGGALGIGACQKVFMMEYSYYSVISPEGGASILWKNRNEAPTAAEKLKITAQEAQQLNLIQGIVPEPDEGAHTDWGKTFQNIKTKLMQELNSSINQIKNKELT
jgi:acetyl-CoA carboxylase carboxyl transferase subunit alpha